MTLKQLYRLSYSLQSEVSELIDACIASKLAKAEVHSPDLITYRGLAFKKAEDEGDHKDTESKFPLDDGEKIALLQSAFPAFEARSGQLEMMNMIHHSFESSQDAIIEAGTGIGKSIGYLLPAVYFAKNIINLSSFRRIRFSYRINFFKTRFLSLRKSFRLPFKLFY